uniref:Putative sugar transporter n=1 Tax=Tabanus bromius TaxID=304241 RepID=A0A0K8TQS7_TABBR
MGKATYTVNSNGIATNPAPNQETEEKPEAGKFRTILPQVLAVSVKNLLLVDLGLSVAFPTIVIPAVRGLNTNYPESLHLTAVQASWLGSIAHICQPLGSVLSGWVSEPIGRKRAMIIVNIPHMIAWIILHFANSIELLYLGAVLLGLGVGFMEAPIITYVGEICQPSVRGILISCAGFAATIGFFIVYLLGSITDWRTAALGCLSLPIITAIAICFIPETPMWLLSKHRKEEALKSLQWLRGWVSPKAVEEEFNEIIRYSENSNKCTECQKADVQCPHPPTTLLQRITELKRKRTIKAFILVACLFAISQFSGIASMRPYMVQIFKAYRVPLDPNWTTVVIGVVGIVANMACMICVKLIGKRRISILGLSGSIVCCICLASYAQAVFPTGWNSFEQSDEAHIDESYLPFTAFILWTFFTFCGISSIPWMLLSEVFPFKSRGIATGITAGINYIFGFIATKTYLNLDQGLGLNGTMWFFTSINILGLLFVLFMMPETENCTLEDIELHFAQNNLKLTDIKIARASTDVESGDPQSKKTEKPKPSVNGAVTTSASGVENRGFSDN